MRFPDRFLDDIRDRLRISEVVGMRVQFDKKKSNPAKGDYWACCPFHGEKTPSFHCEDRKGRYHCFGCGVSGDHFRFITELDGLSFPESVELLAGQAGLPMPVMDRREQEREEKRKSLFDVMELATEFFEAQLQDPPGATARAYLRDRGLSSDIQKEFRIGYAPDSRNSLKEFLAQKGVEAAQMEACGLVANREGNAVSYDRFRGRVMFPIPDSRGRIIAFGGRALSDDALAKYLNSPETELFHKSNVLYNFAKARKPAYEKGQIIACEGYMDVIALHSFGFHNAVAPLGTALTTQQMELLWRMHSEPVLCFDGDGAGVKAAHRVVDLVLPILQPGRSVRFAMLPEGRDPDDLLRESGPDAMQEVLETAIPLSQMLWNREISSGTYDTPERRAELQSRMRQFVAQVRNEEVRHHYGLEIKGRLQSFFEVPEPVERRPAERRSMNSRRPQNRFGGQRNSANAGGRVLASQSLLSSKMVKRGHGGIPLREAALLGGAVFHPAICYEFFEEISSLSLTNKTAIRLQSFLLDCFANWSGETEFPGREAIVELARGTGHIEEVAVLEKQLAENNLWQLLPSAAFEDARDGWTQAYTLHMRNQTLNKELKVAERALAEDDSQENLERLLHIQNELARADGTEALIDGFGLSSGRPSRGF